MNETVKHACQTADTHRKNVRVIVVSVCQIIKTVFVKGYQPFQVAGWDLCC